MKRYRHLPANDRARQETVGHFAGKCSPPISSEDREIADSFDVAKELAEAIALRNAIRHGKMIERIRALPRARGTEK